MQNKPKAPKRFVFLITQLVNRYFSHDVGRDSAALTYYLLFAIFPLLIFVSTLLGVLRLDIESTSAFLLEFIPADVVDVVRSYLVYVSENASRQLMWFSLVFSIWFPMRAASCLMHSVRKAMGRGRPKNAVIGLADRGDRRLARADDGGTPRARVRVGACDASGRVREPVELAAFRAAGRGGVFAAGAAVYARAGRAAAAAGDCAGRRGVARGVDAPELRVFVLCGASRALYAALRRDCGDCRGAAVAVYERNDYDYGRRI